MVETKIDSNAFQLKQCQKVVQTELEKQLHEQYAVNANHNLITMITVAVAALSVIGVYGYVLAHTKFSCGCFFIVDDAVEMYTKNTLLLTACAVLIVLTILFHISLQLGSYQRLEQFITFAIRSKYYNDKAEYDKTFPKNYHPFNKSKCEFVQGLHNTSLKIYIIFYSIVILVTLAVLSYNSCYQCHFCCGQAVAEYPVNCFVLCAFVLTIICTATTMCFNFKRAYDKYLARQDEYLAKESIRKLYKENIQEEKCKEKHKCCLMLCCFCSLFKL